MNNLYLPLSNFLIVSPFIPSILVVFPRKVAYCPFNMSIIGDSSGNLTIINATPFVWHRTLEQSYQMLTWDFPETINPGP